ncbi:phosphotransferase [Streptomyces sp. NPDC005012]|uniref:phosphotransferase enzyme family protein n=1 Tax=Streptomyces sp. NPDC005012 TaxID=3154558 RepID=UPI0033A22FF6
MTTVVSPLTAALAASRTSGITADGIVPLRQHAASIFLAPKDGVVLKVSPASQTTQLAKSLEFVRWLLSKGFPATEPIDLPQPLKIGPYAVTLWRHYPQTRLEPPSAGSLGSLLRELHALGEPPMDLRNYEPLASLREALAGEARLPDARRQWLTSEIDELTDQYEHLVSAIGIGHIHADAYPGNLMWDGAEVRLGDWDEVAVGPRELDLANTFQGVRFGRSTLDLDEFAERYGRDPRNWKGLAVLCRIRDLHTLTTFLRQAARGDVEAAREIDHRLTTLMSGDDAARWNRA